MSPDSVVLPLTNRGHHFHSPGLITFTHTHIHLHTWFTRYTCFASAHSLRHTQLIPICSPTYILLSPTTRPAWINCAC